MDLFVHVVNYIFKKNNANLSFQTTKKKKKLKNLLQSSTCSISSNEN